MRLKLLYKLSSIIIILVGPALARFTICHNISNNCVLFHVLILHFSLYKYTSNVIFALAYQQAKPFQYINTYLMCVFASVHCVLHKFRKLLCYCGVALQFSCVVKKFIEEIYGNKLVKVAKDSALTKRVLKKVDQLYNSSINVLRSKFVIIFMLVSKLLTKKMCEKEYYTSCFHIELNEFNTYLGRNC